MQKVEAIVDPVRLRLLRDMLASVGFTGMTVSEVLGADTESRLAEVRDPGHLAALRHRTRIEIVLEDGRVPLLVDEIIRTARTGRVGDGKIFVLPVLDVVRIRTNERGGDAI